MEHRDADDRPASEHRTAVDRCTPDVHQPVWVSHTCAVLLFSSSIPMTTTLPTSLQQLGVASLPPPSKSRKVVPLPRTKFPGKFILGPLCFTWLAQANALPGKAGAVGLALWFLRGVTRSSRFRLTREVEQLAGCNRQATYHALTALEQAGLITADRVVGARPVVTILAASSGANVPIAAAGP